VRQSDSQHLKTLHYPVSNRIPSQNNLLLLQTASSLPSQKNLLLLLQAVFLRRGSGSGQGAAAAAAALIATSGGVGLGSYFGGALQVESS
jgi:hypothetical protein